MVEFEAEIIKYAKNGEKTGWTFVEIPLDIAVKIKPKTKTSYRVKGKLDNLTINQVALVPVGEGNFILPLNAEMRKVLKKEVGNKLKVSLEEEIEELPISADLLASLDLEPEALSLFNSYPKGHQRYYSNWVESAKTFETKSKRIYMCVYGLLHNMDYGQMIRHFKKEPMS
jgi:Domain of unknown function (DUF1905)/Bacteriocin-protection, YdeI or OmpD-Associated